MTVGPAEDSGAAASASTVPPAHDGSRDRLDRLARTAVGVAFAPVVIAEQLLPRSRPAIYVGGLAAAAALDVLDWPVAAAIAAGVWVSRSSSGRSSSTGAPTPAPS